MRPALPILLLVGCVTQDDVTTTDHAIVGGQTATMTDFPTVVGIQRNGDTLCTGVLVHQDYVLSAASCFDSTNNIRVRIGDPNLGDGTTAGMTIDAAQIIKHPQFSYQDSVWRHDVALIKLATSVTTITPSPIRRDTTAPGAQITQAGFGASSNNGNGTGVLRSLATTNIDCGQAGDTGITNENLLCFNAGDGNGSCFGDGGAPSFIAGTSGRIVVGVGSGGTGSSCTSGLDIYSSLVAELGFLDQYVPPPMGTPPTQPPPPPTTTPPTNPPGGGSGPGRDPGTGSGDGDGRGAVRAVSCNAGGDAGGLAALGLALALALRRRRHGSTDGYSRRPSRGFARRRHRNASST